MPRPLEGSSELAVARRNYAHMGLELTDDEVAAYTEIDKRLEKYRAARDAYRDKGTPQARKAFKDAKAALQEARQAQYAIESAHEQHHRDKSFAEQAAAGSEG